MNFNELIYSPRMNIHFAGFKANAWELQSAGWAFTAYERMSHSQHGRELQIMLNHDGAGITMVSTASLFKIEELFRDDRFSKPQFLFQVMGIQVEGRTSFVEHPRMEDMNFFFDKHRFTSVDMAPRYEKVNLSKINLNEFGVFKKINDAANVFLPEKTVNELMEEILKKQEPTQKEIRKNRNRESFMQEFNRNPNEEIKLQLIAV